jgi:hypothetical protein
MWLTPAQSRQSASPHTLLQVPRAKARLPILLAPCGQVWRYEAKPCPEWERHDYLLGHPSTRTAALDAGRAPLAAGPSLIRHRASDSAGAVSGKCVLSSEFFALSS